MTSDVFLADAPQHVRWNELSTTDADAAITFYTKPLRLARKKVTWTWGTLGTYSFVQHGGMAIGAIMPKMPEMPVSMWSYYIGVDDIDRAVAAIGVAGGTVVHGPMEIPGGEYALNGIDPQGAAFGLVGPRKNWTNQLRRPPRPLHCCQGPLRRTGPVPGPARQPGWVLLHDPGHQDVDLGPRGAHLRRERIAQSLLQSLEQGRAHGVIVSGLYPIPSVALPETEAPAPTHRAGRACQPPHRSSPTTSGPGHALHRETRPSA